MTPAFIIQYLQTVKGGAGQIHLNYEESFASLWQSLEKLSFEEFLSCLGANGIARMHHVWIVWRETPNDTTTSPVPAGVYLTPIDWAAVAANKYQGQVQVTVIDMDAVRHKYPPTCQLYSQCDKRKFSWLRVIPILDLPFEKKHIPFCPSSSSIPPSFFVETIKHNLTQTTAVADRHAITNIVGPMVLLGGESSQNGTDRKYFVQLMQSIGLVGKGAGRSFPWFPKEKWNGKVEKFVLLDDMHKLGWAEFLRKALEINDDSRLLAFENVEDKGITRQDKTLTDLLEEKFVQGEITAGPDRRTGEGLTLCGEEKVVLFLDLRLFTMSGNNERAFLQRLVAVARQVPTDKLKLPWPEGGFSKEELEIVERWASSSEGVTSHAYYTALTLLPRLLALADPMLPIVIFSTAGQPETVKALQHYGNIILDFHKPRFFGDASDVIVAETKEKLVRAMNRALALVHGRNICRSYLRHGNGPSRHKEDVASPARDNNPVVEIYIDESGEAYKSKFGVGGLLAVYPSEASIATFQSQLPSYGYTRDDESITFLNDHKIKEPQNPNMEEPPIMEVVRTAATSLGVILSAFFVQEKRESPSTTGSGVDDLTNPSSLDNRYRHLLRMALEMVLFEYLPHLEMSGVQIKNLKPQCRIYVATRYLPASHRDLQTSQQRVQIFERYQKDFGVELNIREYILGCYLLSDNEVYPIVAEVKRRRESSDFQPKIIAARATQLVYFCDRESRARTGAKRERCPTHEGYLKRATPRTQGHVRLPRKAHYLADIVCRWAIQERNYYPEPFELLFKEGFNTRVEYSHGWLEAGLAADNGQWVDAIIAVENAKAIAESSTENFSFSKYVQPKTKNSVKNLKGPDFIELCRRLEAGTEKSD